MDAWESSGGRGVVEAATGTGKTAVALGAAARLRAAHGLSLRVVVVVPTLALARQWVDAFQGTLQVPKSLIGEQHSAALKAVNPRTAVVITVINTARIALADRVNDWVRSGRTVLLIVDECHRAGGEWNSKIFEAQAPYTLGLSATPERDDGGHDTYIYPGLGKPVYRYGLRKALDDGVLAPVRSVNLYVDFTAQEGGQWRRLTDDLTTALRRIEDEHPGITDDPARMWAQIGKLANQEEPTAMRVVALLNSRRVLVSEASARHQCLASIEEWLLEHGHRAMVFHETIAAAERVAEQLRALGGNVSLDHSKRSKVEREYDLRRFRLNQTQILVAVRSLDEGIDVPDASVAVLAAGSRSRRQRIQRFGRILRPGDQKQAMALSILIRSTPEESEVGDRDEELLGPERVAHHRWPGRSIADAVAQESTYRPMRRRLNRLDQLTAVSLGISPSQDALAKVQELRTPDPGGYVAAVTHFSPNAWHVVAEVRLHSGMPPEAFDKLASPIRRSWYGSLDRSRRSDPSLIYGGEVEAIRRSWEQNRRAG